MRKPFRVIVFGNTIIVVLIVTYFLLIPAGTVFHALADAELRSGRVPRFVFRWHQSLSQRIEIWARQRVASGRAARLNYTNVSGTEWPVFSSVFYLWGTEALQEAWDRDASLAPVMPRQYARGAIEAVAELVADSNHGAWVRKWWGDSYLRRENLFYRMLLIGGLTSYQRLSRDHKYEVLLRDQVVGLGREIDESPFGLLDDYPGQCYPVDVLTAIAAIQHADDVIGTDHRAFVERARRGFQGARLDAETNLPAWVADSKTGDGMGSARGVGLAFMLCWVPTLWPDVARLWYPEFEKQFWQEGRFLAGFREYPRDDQVAKNWMYDVDAGPVLGGYGTAASAFGIGAARANGQLNHAYSLSEEALVAAWPLPDGRLLLPSLLSNLSDAPLTGEAALLFSLTRTPANGVAVIPCSTKRGYLPLILYGGSGIALLALVAERARRWERRGSSWIIPVFSFQVYLWLGLIGGGIILMLLSRELAAVLSLFFAQLLPAARKQTGRLDVARTGPE